MWMWGGARARGWAVVYVRCWRGVRVLRRRALLLVASTSKRTRHSAVRHICSLSRAMSGARLIRLRTLGSGLAEVTTEVSPVVEASVDGSPSANPSAKGKGEKTPPSAWPARAQRVGGCAGGGEGEGEGEREGWWRAKPRAV
ncbi:hypothetical protein B0H19DRAFT_1104216 [Mycena capillaripes]|nr:hypothetical protein B0H19DRAFT_1104216 [Mycena capillaripes]